MLPRNHPDRIRIAFDDHRLVANAGLLLPATLAQHLGLPQLLQQHLDLGDAPGRANSGNKLMTLVASALAGGDCIDDADVLRTGGTACAPGCVFKAPSTLGTFLPSFRQTGPLSHGRPLLMAVRGVDSNISNLPTRGAQTASVSEGLFITVQRDVPSGGAAGVLSVQGRADGVGQSVLAPPNSGV